MNLSRDVARCPGRFYEAPDGRLTEPQCVDCARRLAAIADYVNGADVEWIEPPQETPCPERRT